MDAAAKLTDKATEQPSFEQRQLLKLREENRKFGLGLSSHVLDMAEAIMPRPAESLKSPFFLVFKTGNPQESFEFSWKRSGFRKNGDFPLHYPGGPLRLYDNGRPECEERIEHRSISWIPVDFHTYTNKSARQVREQLPLEFLSCNDAIIAAKYFRRNVIIPGYEVAPTWDGVVTIEFNGNGGKINLGNKDIDFVDSGYTVPVVSNPKEIRQICCF